MFTRVLFVAVLYQLKGTNVQNFVPVAIFTSNQLTIAHINVIYFSTLVYYYYYYYLTHRHSITYTHFYNVSFSR